MTVNYKVFQSKRKSGSMKDKFYARAAHRETVSIKDIAQTMQANSTVKYSDVLAVLTELAEVIKAELLRGNVVKIDGLGSFKVGLKSSPADTAKEFTAANITGSRINFMPETKIDRTSGKHIKSLLYGLRVAEAASYDSPRTDATETEQAGAAQQEPVQE